jgi:hypothetical protein
MRKSTDWESELTTVDGELLRLQQEPRTSATGDKILVARKAEIHQNSPDASWPNRSPRERPSSRRYGLSFVPLRWGIFRRPERALQNQLNCALMKSTRPQATTHLWSNSSTRPESSCPRSICHGTLRRPTNHRITTDDPPGRMDRYGFFGRL